VLKLKALCSTQSIEADWQVLMEDEPTREYFLRMATSVACMGEIFSIQTDQPEGKAARDGLRNIVKYVLSSSIAEDFKKGAIKP